MTKVLRGKRIGENGRIRLGCSGVIFDESREKVLLTKRADNGLWCLPSGGGPSELTHATPAIAISATAPPTPARMRRQCFISPP